MSRYLPHFFEPLLLLLLNMSTPGTAQADKYANLAVRHDRYNAKALVNLGNCCVDQVCLLLEYVVT
jgi:hypothetical protein